MTENRLVLDAQLVETQPLRMTPGGVPVVECLLAHRSRQQEAGSEREVSCEFRAVALGDPARLVAAASPGSRLRVAGFLAARSLKNRSPVLHLNTVEFLEGTNHGLWK
ncbi:MAG: primosomal replication protein N [Bdellovibrionales bacterium]|nr:primosomal replication protein N [Bdellovibrionales bacterium]